MGAIHIDAAEVQGEKYTGYEDGKKGPFRCSNCRYFDHGTCSQSTMRAKSHQPARGGGVKVDPAGCCEYIERKERKLYGGRKG